jgi:hypothetical protein
MYNPMHPESNPIFMLGRVLLGSALIASGTTVAFLVRFLR